MQAFKQLTAALVKDPNGTVITTTNNPATLHTWCDLQGDITANRMAEGPQKGGRNPSRDIRYRIRINAVDEIRD